MRPTTRVYAEATQDKAANSPVGSRRQPPSRVTVANDLAHVGTDCKQPRPQLTCFRLPSEKSALWPDRERACDTHLAEARASVTIFDWAPIVTTPGAFFAVSCFSNSEDAETFAKRFSGDRLP